MPRKRREPESSTDLEELSVHEEEEEEEEAEEEEEDIVFSYDEDQVEVEVFCSFCSFLWLTLLLSCALMRH